MNEHQIKVAHKIMRAKLLVRFLQESYNNQSLVDLPLCEELVLILELPLAEVVIAFGSGEVSTMRLPLRF